VSITTKNIKYFSFSLFYLILSKVFSLFFRLGSRVIIARYSNADIYGIFSVIWNEINLISIVLLVGLGQQLTIKIPRTNKADKSELIYSSLYYSIIISLLSGILSIVFYFCLKESTYSYSFFISSIFLLFLLMQFIFIGLKDFFGFFLITSSQNTLFAILVFIFRNKLSVPFLILLLFCSIILSDIIGFIYLVRKQGLKLIKSISIRKKMFVLDRKRFYLFSVDIVNSLINYLMLKLAQIIIGSTLSGYINIAFSLINFIMIPPQMIATSIGPRFSEDFSTYNYKGMTTTLRIGLSLTYLIQGIVIILFSYFGFDALYILYGHEYVTQSYPIYLVFLFCTIIQSLTFPFGFFIRNSDNELIFALGKICQLLVFLISEVLFLFFYNSKGVGVAFSWFISLIFLVGFYFYNLIKTNPHVQPIDIKKMIFWLILIFINISSGVIFSNYITNFLWKIAVFSGSIVIFSSFLLLFKIINVMSVFTELKNLIKRKSS